MLYVYAVYSTPGTFEEFCVYFILVTILRGKLQTILKTEKLRNNLPQVIQAVHLGFEPDYLILVSFLIDT